MRIRIVSGLAVAVALVFTAGCSKKVPECNSIVDVIKVNAEKTMKGSDAAAFRGEADNADKAVAGLGKLEFTVPELKKLAGDIAAAYKAEAEAARKMATATEGVGGTDPEKITAAAAEVGKAGDALGKSTEALSKAAGDLDKFCGAN